MALRKSRITGTGACLPETVLTNDDLAKIVDTSDEWIVSRTGIRERRIVKIGVEASSDLAHAAARRALEMAGRDPKDLDLIVRSKQRVPSKWSRTPRRPDALAVLTSSTDSQMRTWSMASSVLRTVTTLWTASKML